MKAKHHKVTISTSNGSIYPLPDGFKAVRASLTFEGDDLRFTFDDTQNIGTSVGHLAKDGGAVDIFDTEINLFRAVSAGTTTIQCTLYDTKDDKRYA
jgi:hypothetical protein